MISARWIVFVIGLLLLIAGVAVQAQDSTCPANVLLAQARTGAVCQLNAERNTACLGNGVASAQNFAASDMAGFTQPGDIADLDHIAAISSGDSTEWSMVSLQVQADLPDSEQRAVTILLFGDTTVVNHVPPAITFPATATGQVNVRRLPQANAEIVEELGIRSTLIARGRSADSQWLRVVTTSGLGQGGWASVATLQLDSGTVAALPVIEPDSPFLRPFQVLSLMTGSDDAFCENAPDSGVIIQSPPNMDAPVNLTINEIDLSLSATLHIQTGETMTFSILEGEIVARWMGETQFVPAGAQLQVPLGADNNAVAQPGTVAPLDLRDLAVLPLNNLPSRIQVAAALSQDQIDSQIAAWAAPTPTPLPESDPDDPNVCRRRLIRDADLYAGPGTNFEVINSIGQGTIVRPIRRAQGSDGQTWYQLNNSNWLRAALVEEGGVCQTVPLVENARPPRSNTLSLETCETTNGPLRAGQQVTITFLPAAWETYADAVAAPRIDPGRITVDSQALWVRARSIVQVAEERYLRTFYASWTATAGTHRIVGERLSYSPSCTLTVPVG